jgi:hypothetical protein
MVVEAREMARGRWSPFSPSSKWTGAVVAEDMVERPKLASKAASPLRVPALEMSGVCMGMKMRPLEWGACQSGICAK